VGVAAAGGVVHYGQQAGGTCEGRGAGIMKGAAAGRPSPSRPRDRQGKTPEPAAVPIQRNGHGCRRPGPSATATDHEESLGAAYRGRQREGRPVRVRGGVGRKKEVEDSERRVRLADSARIRWAPDGRCRLAKRTGHQGEGVRSLSPSGERRRDDAKGKRQWLERFSRRFVYTFRGRTGMDPRMKANTLARKMATEVSSTRPRLIERSALDSGR